MATWQCVHLLQFSGVCFVDQDWASGTSSISLVNCTVSHRTIITVLFPNMHMLCMLLVIICVNIEGLFPGFNTFSYSRYCTSMWTMSVYSSSVMDIFKTPNILKVCFYYPFCIKDSLHEILVRKHDYSLTRSLRVYNSVHNYIITVNQKSVSNWVEATG